ncbi:GNAT family N-acetyltransferase [Pleomorphomonas koreensis]|uniref:GNAT family N-acetyltransferase n=1 Tax=Pleomorphomonas koreensis TaxID=257440 RepID=UPI000417BD28|nr:GNAT family N-acetyltransferase [Pleomorphomonas koreensis]
MTEQPLIRPAIDADGAGIAHLIAAVFGEYDGCPFVIAEFPELAAPASHYERRGGRLFVAEDGGAIVGSFAISSPDDDGVFEINKVYLDRRRRGSGLALRLYETAIAEARARGCRTLKLWTDTRFLSGHRFYEKLGFARQPVVRYLADATDGWEFAYRLDLPQPA